MRRIGDVELSEDMRHERREWIAQRIGWGAMALFLAVAAAGGFGSGPLARAHASAAGLEVDYPRFMRDASLGDLEVHIATPRLWLGHELGERLTVEAVTPPPSRVALLGDRWVYEYDGAPGLVTVRLRPHRVGAATLRLGAVDGGEVRLAPLVWP